jgi:hypothetical protein
MVGADCRSWRMCADDTNVLKKYLYELAPQFQQSVSGRNNTFIAMLQMTSRMPGSDMLYTLANYSDVLHLTYALARFPLQNIRSIYLLGLYNNSWILALCTLRYSLWLYALKYLFQMWHFLQYILSSEFLFWTFRKVEELIMPIIDFLCYSFGYILSLFSNTCTYSNEDKEADVGNVMSE